MNANEGLVQVAGEGAARLLDEEQGSQRSLLIGLLAGAAVVVLDFFIVLACLAPIQQSLSVSQAELQLIVASYAIANGSFLVVGGRLGDVLGRRRVFLWGVGLFALASAACGAAGTGAALIMFRVLQGLAGAMLQPQVLGLLAVNFEPSQRQRLFGIYAATLGVAGVMAQLIGGVLVDWLPADLGWRACFWLSVPVCALSMFMVGGAKESPAAVSRKIDWLGAALLAICLGSLCSVLTLGREAQWPAWTLVATMVALIAAGALWWWCSIGKYSGAERIIPVGIMARNRFWLALAAVLAFYGGVASFYFVLALELRLSAHYSATEVGLLFAWMGTCFVLASMSPRYKAALGQRWGAAGLWLLALGHVIMAIAAAELVGPWQVAGFMASAAFQGVGLGTLMGPLMASAVSRVRSEEGSVGGGLAAATQQIGNSLGISVIGFAYFGVGTVNGHHPWGASLYLVATLVMLGLALKSIRPPGR